MKKILVLLLSALVCIAAVGCGGEKKEKASATTDKDANVEENGENNTHETDDEADTVTSAENADTDVTDADKEEVSEITWNFDETTKTLTISGKGDMEDYNISQKPWEVYRELIEKVVIEYGVTSIGDLAFSNCTGLTDVFIPDSVTSIGNSAFFCCESLAKVIIPESVTFIGSQAFSYTALKWTGASLIVDNCLLETATYEKPYAVGKDIRLIAADALNDCSEINVDKKNPYYSSVSGVLFNKDKTVIVAYPGFMNSSSYNIPDGVTKIGDWALSGSGNLVGITIPDSVTSIGDYAFSYCFAFTEITIPDNVTSIGFNAFGGCESLTKITIPDSVTSIGDYAFHSTSLTEISIPDSVTSIGKGIFSYCSDLTDVYYSGTEEQWNAVVGDGNEDLKSVTIHFNA